MFIELQEYHYRGGGYLTKPLLLNVDEISTVIEDDGHGYVRGRRVVMNNRKTYYVKDSYADIVRMLNGD